VRYLSAMATHAPMTRSAGRKTYWFVRLALLPAAVVAFQCIALAQEACSMISKQPIGEAGTETIYKSDLPDSVVGQLEHLQQRAYELTADALDDVTRQKLLATEAKKRGLTVEQLLRQEVDAKIADPTRGEVEAFYFARKRLDSLPLSEVQSSLAWELKQARIQESRKLYLDALEKRSTNRVFLKRPRVEVAYDVARLKGDSSAAITIIEFSDFTCPFSRQAEATLDTLLAKYAGKLRIAYRDFPADGRSPPSGARRRSFALRRRAGEILGISRPDFQKRRTSEARRPDRVCASVGARCPPLQFVH